jgi:hypothetical protein
MWWQACGQVVEQLVVGEAEDGQATVTQPATNDRKPDKHGYEFSTVILVTGSPFPSEAAREGGQGVGSPVRSWMVRG